MLSAPYANSEHSPVRDGGCQRREYSWLEHLMTSTIEIFPPIAFPHHRLQVFQPDNPILYRIFNNRSNQSRRQIVGTQCPIAIVASHGQTTINHRDSLSI